MAKNVGLIALGFLVGVAVSFSVGDWGGVAAQQAANPRLVWKPATSNTQAENYFIKDTKTGACWILAGMGLATAPTQACD